MNTPLLWLFCSLTEHNFPMGKYSSFMMSARSRTSYKNCFHIQFSRDAWTVTEHLYAMILTLRCCLRFGKSNFRLPQMIKIKSLQWLYFPSTKVLFFLFYGGKYFIKWGALIFRMTLRPCVFVSADSLEPKDFIPWIDTSKGTKHDLVCDLLKRFFEALFRKGG